LALGAAEGALAAWGYAFGPARLPQDAPDAGTEPPRRRTGWFYLAAAAVIGLGVAPLVPPFPFLEGAVKPWLALARETRAPYLIKVIAGGVTVVAAAVVMSAAAAAAKIGGGGTRKK